MNKFFVTLAVACVATSCYAQGRGEREGRQGNSQVRSQVSIPVSVLRSILPLDKSKLDALEEDAKLFQMAGLPLEALAELKLTSEQKKTISSVASEAAEKAREFMREGDREGAMALREQLGQKVGGVLTLEQKKVLEKYPFRPMGNRGFGGFGGPGGGRRGNPPII